AFEAGQIRRRVANRGASLLFVPKRHCQLGVDLCEDSLVETRYLLANHSQSDSELTPLTTDVAENAPELDALGIQNARRFLDHDVDERELIELPKFLGVQVGKSTIREARNQLIRERPHAAHFVKIVIPKSSANLHFQPAPSVSRTERFPERE